MNTTLRILTPDDVNLYRTARLNALRLEPRAFGSPLAVEQAFTEEQWLSRISPPGGAVFGVIENNELLAMCTAIVDMFNPENAMLVAMWTEPHARRRGLGKQLVNAAVDFATTHSFPTLSLSVTVGNDAAMELYAACGFMLTGTSTTRPTDGEISLEMARRLHQ
jgi:ribosomal protein S18 acetylase RimI-like enzyme